MSIVSVMPSNHLILCHPLLLLPSILPSIRVFSNESALCIRWAKYWSFSFSMSPSSGYSGLIFFRIDWFDLLTVQGTLKSLLQHHSLKASILQCSTFFKVQLLIMHLFKMWIIVRFLNDTTLCLCPGVEAPRSGPHLSLCINPSKLGTLETWLGGDLVRGWGLAAGAPHPSRYESMWQVTCR